MSDFVGDLVWRDDAVAVDIEGKGECAARGVDGECLLVVELLAPHIGDGVNPCVRGFFTLGGDQLGVVF